MAGYLPGVGQLAAVSKSAAPNLGSAAVSGSLNPNLASTSGPQQSADPMSQLVSMRRIATGGGPDAASAVAGAGVTANPSRYSGSAPVPVVSGPAPSGNMAQWIAQAEQIAGVNPALWTQGLNLIAQHESGGNPAAINNWDSNAAAGHPSQGLMQEIPSTFSAYVPKSLASEGILNPVANIAAAIGYINSRYGGINNVPGVVAVAQGRPYVGY